jgi:hypothetical protein
MPPTALYAFSPLAEKSKTSDKALPFSRKKHEFVLLASPCSGTGRPSCPPTYWRTGVQQCEITLLKLFQYALDFKFSTNIIF